MLDKVLEYLFAAHENTENMCIYINAHIQECNEYQVAQIIFDLRTDTEEMIKIIHFFNII